MNNNTLRKKYYWVEKFENGEYISEWNGYTPFYIGCFNGSNLVLGGEEKFKDCYGFFSGIGDVDWWNKRELDKLTEKEQEDLLSILKRNKHYYEYKSELASPLSMLLKVQPYQIYRLSSLEFKGILDLIDSKSNSYKPHVEGVEIVPTKNVSDEPDDIFYKKLLTGLNVNA